MNDQTKLQSDGSDESIDKERRRFLLSSACVLGGLGAVCSLVPLASAWLPNSKTRAGSGAVQLDLSRMEAGEQQIVEWQGKPVWIIKRTKAMLQQLDDSDHSQLRDPLSVVKQQPEYAKNKYRSRRPEYLILIGLCTHLGCSPKYKPQLNELGANWPGGFFCPCHGSTFDLAGRVFKGVPAPINLAVPPHHFVNATTVIIGEA